MLRLLLLTVSLIFCRGDGNAVFSNSITLEEASPCHVPNSYLWSNISGTNTSWDTLEEILSEDSFPLCLCPVELSSPTSLCVGVLKAGASCSSEGAAVCGSQA